MKKRVAITIEGIVQGVGFRPFVFRVAQTHGITGWVLNEGAAVLIEAEGSTDPLDLFCQTIKNEHPPLASIVRFDTKEIPAAGDNAFSIRQSQTTGAKKVHITPDANVCPDCLKELLDPSDRRYRYPFINCTNCGPRYTIVTGTPYDRGLTTMVDFPMCPDCQAEYDDPASRRFHAQPNACPDCGPSLQFVDNSGKPIETTDPLTLAIEKLRSGKILAIKGLGGYHLVVDACNETAVKELRRRKQRDEKPFALMAFESERIQQFAHISETELQLLESVERPIVLLEKKTPSEIDGLVAPNNNYLGVMLPYTPLHYLLLQDQLALVMTSGNLSDEPIAFEDQDSFGRLSSIADYFLIHNRRIHTRTDDSIVRQMGGHPLVLRRSRGYVPRSLALPKAQPAILATGAELKNTLCYTQGERAFLSHHIGDLKNPETFRSFEKAAKHLSEILEITPKALAHDLHPDYFSSQWATQQQVKTIAVQHHHAHMASCMAENALEGDCIGVILDGAGLGTDGKIWGGEFLVGGYEGFRRAGHFDYMPMPGGDAATKEPFRMALSYLHRAFGKEIPALPFLDAIPKNELDLYWQMIEKGINSPLTSSCGRLFDAVAALVGIRNQVSFEGQAAMELEMAINSPQKQVRSYPFLLHRKKDQADETTYVVEFEEMIKFLVKDLLTNTSTALISTKFHNGLVNVIRLAVKNIRRDTQLDRVVLSGGVFQNRYLTETAIKLLQADGLKVFTHSLIPPNDGGIALGQAIIAGHSLTSP